MKLTKAAVAGLSLPAGCDEKTYWDDDIPLFGVRLRKGGSKGWVFWYRLGGRASPLRKMAWEQRAPCRRPRRAPRQPSSMPKSDSARTPRARRPKASRGQAKRSRVTCFRLFLARQAKRLKPRSYAEVERHLLAQAKPLHRLQLAAVDRRTVAKLLAEIGESAGPSAANRLRSDLHTFCIWAMREGLIEQNVVRQTRIGTKSPALVSEF